MKAGSNSLEIIVLVKMVAEIFASSYKQLSIEELLDKNRRIMSVNSYDLAALEEARQIKESLGFGNITAITVGDEESRKALRVACSMGADELIWINSPSFTSAKVNNVQLAKLLARLIMQRTYNLILCGVKSDDLKSGTLGIALAEYLNLPVVTRSWYIEPGKDLRVAYIYKHTGKGNQEVVECPLPAVVTVERSRKPLGRPSMLRYIKSRRKIIEESCPPLDEDSSGFIIEISAPRSRPKKIFTPEDSLSAADRMRLIMSGGVNRKKENRQDLKNLSGAELLYDYLKKNKFI
ncbi:MAG: hypothetical protein QXP27_07580 [Candidatus Methanomethyliaceae archaeon]